jgi:hypothetical protein
MTLDEPVPMITGSLDLVAIGRGDEWNVRWIGTGTQSIEAQRFGPRIDILSMTDHQEV